MTLETGRAGPGISIHFLVLIVHIRLVVFMAISAGKGSIVGIGMTFCAGIPLPLVTSRIHREVSIMYCKPCRFPSRICCVAIVACSRNVGLNMIRVGCLVVISLMTGKTFCRSAGIISVGMTSVAIRDRMTAGERKGGVIKICGRPTGIGGMAIVTIGGEMRGRMIGIYSLVIILAVAGITFT